MKANQTKEVLCCECGCITIKKEAVQSFTSDGKPSDEWTCEACIREIAPGFSAIAKKEAR